jgi:nitroimidazol reductase NimA-like FMN-containing flavoprotein (pyridoxamine 5'-phosphate oxidase superfamily)
MPQGGAVAHLSTISRDCCLALLGSVPYGRVVFTDRALPAVRPVNHIVDDGNIIIRSSLGSGITRAAGAGMVVAYEADAIDPDTHTGWSVVVTGLARIVVDPAHIARYERLLEPWVDGRQDWVVRIPPDLVTGYRLVNLPTTRTRKDITCAP